MKYTVGFSRKVQTMPYENMEVTLTAEFDDEETPMEYAKDMIVGKVNGWIDEELRSMGLPHLQKAAVLKEETRIC